MTTDVTHCGTVHVTADPVNANVAGDVAVTPVVVTVNPADVAVHPLA